MVEKIQESLEDYLRAHKKDIQKNCPGFPIPEVVKTVPHLVKVKSGIIIVLAGLDIDESFGNNIIKEWELDIEGIVTNRNLGELTMQSECMVNILLDWLREVDCSIKGIDFKKPQFIGEDFSVSVIFTISIKEV